MLKVSGRISYHKTKKKWGKKKGKSSHKNISPAKRYQQYCTIHVNRAKQEQKNWKGQIKKNYFKKIKILIIFTKMINIYKRSAEKNISLDRDPYQPHAFTTKYFLFFLKKGFWEW